MSKIQAKEKIELTGDGQGQGANNSALIGDPSRQAVEPPGGGFRPSRIDHPIGTLSRGTVPAAGVLRAKMTLSRRPRPILDLACPASLCSPRKLWINGTAGHVVVAFRDLRLFPRAAPVLPAAGEADDQVRSMVSVA